MAHMNSGKQFPSRRALLRLFGSAALMGIVRKPSKGSTKLQWHEQPASGCATTRRYRADAHVTVLSVPVLRRSAVGAGKASWAEDAGIRFLDFSGYSVPERAAGLSRFGLIRELSRLDGNSNEFIYFGLMTASPEESASEAKKALHAHASNVVYNAIEGRVAPGVAATARAQVTGTAKFSVNEHGELVEMARQALASSSGESAELVPPTNSERTFLQAIAALLHHPGSGQTLYLYNGQPYRLHLQKSADPKTTAYFRERRLVSSTANVIGAEGTLRREAGGKETTFQLWIEDGAARPLPLRIEYQPKSYLRLVFEVEDQQPC
jgi:hypothetical protein